MSREILTVVETVSNEKGLPAADIFGAIEQALMVATKKKVYPDEPEVSVRVTIDRKTGDYDTYRVWEVVADHDHEMPACQKAISDMPNHAIGDVIEEQIESIEFGRIAATFAKQVIIQKIRDAERAQVAEAFVDKVMQIVSGEVKKQLKDGYIIDLGDNAEGYLPKSEVLPRELLRPKTRLAALLTGINRDGRGAQLQLSRTHPQMLAQLLAKEVPEIAEGIIEVKDVARIAGLRAKASVKTYDHRIDPVGACIGMRGTRIQAVQGELDGERVDVVVWDENPVQYIINALEPADVKRLILDEDAKSADILFDENDQLARAIGSQGQNVRLASELTGYKLNMMLAKDYEAQEEDVLNSYTQLFYDKLEVDEDLAEALVAVGFTSLDEVAYVAPDAFYDIDGLDDEAIEMIQERARAVVIAEAASLPPIDESLLALPQMSERIARALMAIGVNTADDLAEQAIADLEGIELLDESLAGQLIMSARQAWFE